MTDKEKIEKLREALEAARVKHLVVEDDKWYSCPQSPDGPKDAVWGANDCDCGADYHNAQIDRVLKETE